MVPDSALPGPADAVLGAIREVVEQLFSNPHNPLLHNSPFWTTFFHSVVIDISAGLMIQPGYEVRHELIRYTFTASCAQYFNCHCSRQQ